MLRKLGESTDYYASVLQNGSSGHTWERKASRTGDPTPGAWSYAWADKKHKKLSLTDVNKNLCPPVQDYILYSWNFQAETEMKEYIKKGRIFPGPAIVDCIYYRNDSSPSGRGKLNKPCLANRHCDAPLVCSYASTDKKLTQQVCLKPNNVACDNDWECISGKCKGKKCGNKYQIPYWVITVIILTVIAVVIKSML